jgi:hypothetical protein
MWNASHPPLLGFPIAATAALPGRPAGHVSRMCETTGAPVIGSACYGFECVNNLSYGDRCHNLYRRSCPQKRLHSLQIRQDALQLVSTLALGVG